MKQHRGSLHFAPRPGISAVITNTPGGDKKRVRLKLKCSEVKLHLCKPVNSGDETAAFSMSNLFVANDYVLTLCNNTELQLPSQLIFSDYLQNDCEESLCLQKKIILPVKATKKCTNVTLVAEVSKINQTAMQEIQNSEYFMEADRSSSSGRNYSHNQTNRDMLHKSTQNSYSIIKDD